MRFDSCGAAINGLGFRDREDELRAKQLEQEIAEGRRRRQALRQRQRRPDSVDETNHDAGKKEREIQNTMDTLVGTTERMKLTGGLNEQKSTKPLDESTSSERPTADNKKPAPPPLKSKPSLEALEGHPHLRPKTSSEGISSKKDIPPAVKSKPAGLEPKSKSSVEDLKSQDTTYSKLKFGSEDLDKKLSFSPVRSKASGQASEKDIFRPKQDTSERRQPPPLKSKPSAEVLAARRSSREDEHSPKSPYTAGSSEYTPSRLGNVGSEQNTPVRAEANTRPGASKTWVKPAEALEGEMEEIKPLAYTPKKWTTPSRASEQITPGNAEEETKPLNHTPKSWVKHSDEGASEHNTPGSGVKSPSGGSTSLDRIKEITGSLSDFSRSKNQSPMSPVQLEDKDDIPASQKRVVSGPKPPVAPKPRNLTPKKHPKDEQLQGEETKNELFDEQSSYSYKSPVSGRGFHKSKSLSVTSVSLPAPNTPPTAATTTNNVETTPGSASSAGRSRSPTRVGFVQSAMLRRENSTINRTPTYATAGGLNRTPTSASTTNSPFRNSFHSRNGSSPSGYPNLSHPSTEHLRMSSSVSNGSISSISSSSSDGDRPSARSNHSTPNSDSRRWSPVRQPTWLESALKKTGPPTPEQGLVRAGTLARSSSRSPVKQHSRTNSSPPDTQSPAEEPVSTATPLTRTSTLRPTDTPPTTTSDDGRPSQLTRSASTLRSTPSEEKKPAVFEKPSPLTRSSTVRAPEATTTSPGQDRANTLRPPVDLKPIARRTPEKSSDEPTAPFLVRSNSLKPTPPKPQVSKPSPEAIERLKSLRSTKPAKNEKKDEDKETLEKAKAGLRRSNTVQYQAPDTVKERLLEAKSSLRSSVYGGKSSVSSASSDIIEEEEPEENSKQSRKQVDSTSSPPRPNPPKKSSSFADDLENALKLGPAPMDSPQPQPGIKKASTFDSSELSSPRPQKKLSHMTKGRAKGPKRRLPTSAKTDSAALSSPSQSTLNVPKNRTPSSTKPTKPPIRSSSRTVSYSRSPSGKQPPPKPRTPASVVNL